MIIKHRYFLFLALLISSALSAQQKSPVPVVGGSRTINGYTVSLVRGNSGGYDILLSNNGQTRRIQNPMPYEPKGIQQKEDAFKIAGWLIQDYQSNGQWSHLIPIKVAHDLKISNFLSPTQNSSK